MRPVIVLALGVLVAAGCAARAGESSRALTVPDELRSSFDLFSRRCSKCHALARPLDSGIDSEDQWLAYVERMRLMPGSGISRADEEAILPFLRWYAAEQRRRKQPDGGAP